MITNKTYVLRKSSEMTETDVVDGYETSRHVCINMLPIYLSCGFVLKIKLVLLESFVGCDVVKRTQRYKRTVAISTPRYVETALYGNSVLRIPHYNRVDCIH